MSVVSIANSNDGNHFSSLFLRPLDRHYQLQGYCHCLDNMRARETCRCARMNGTVCTCAGSVSENWGENDKNQTRFDSTTKAEKQMI